MKIYAYVENGVVSEVIQPLLDNEGSEIPIDQRYTPEFVANCVDVTGIDPSVQSNDLAVFDGEAWEFRAYVPPKPTLEVIVATNSRQRDFLLNAATLAIAPLQDAVDLDEASADEIALLKQWKQFRISVNRIVLTDGSPEWPQPPRPVTYLVVDPAQAADA